MSELSRFGVSIEKTLLEFFDRFITDQGFFNRCEAIRDLVRGKLSVERGFKTDNIMDTVTIINNHHRRNLAEHLTYIEHGFQRDTPFSSHVHISRDLCLEVIVVKANENKLREFTNVIGGREHDRGHGH